MRVKAGLLQDFEDEACLDGVPRMDWNHEGNVASAHLEVAAHLAGLDKSMAAQVGNKAVCRYGSKSAHASTSTRSTATNSGRGPGSSPCR